jgi:hypothetical protein
MSWPIALETMPFVKHDDTRTFESFVRPSVVPVFRPPPARPIPPLPDPEQGKTVITGMSGGQAIMLTKSEQSSWSRSKPVEAERKVTVQRVYQKETDGTVNKENYVDVEHATEMTMQEGDGTLRHEYYTQPTEAPNIETIETNKTIKNPDLPYILQPDPF